MATGMTSGVTLMTAGITLGITMSGQVREPVDCVFAGLSECTSFS